MQRGWMTAGMVWAMMGLMAGGGWAQMPTTEERARESSLNLEYCRWRASFLRLEKREEAPLVACYRKDFTLTAKPRQAAITVNAPYFGRYWFAVNGQALLEPRADRLQVGGLRNLDITAWLRQGQNTITFKGEVKGIWLNSWLSIEGIAFGEDGSTTRLLTDGWKGGWSAPEGWDLPAPQASRQAGKPDKETVGLTPLRNYEPLKGDPGGDALTLPYYGPIQVSPLGIREPIYDEGKPIQLDVTLLNVQSQVQPTLAVEIVDEMSRKPVGQQTVTLSPKGKLDLAGSVRHAGLPAGAYRFRFVLTAEGKEVDRRDYEVACVGEIKQRRVDGTHFEDGLELKEIWRVDCTAEPKPGEFVASIGGRQWKEGEWQEVETKVEQGAAGKYRALADARPFAFLAYRYKVQRLFTPHLVVVEWPDDAERSFIAHVTEGTTMFPNPRHRYVTGGYQRAEASVVSQHDLQPRRSNRMQKLHLLYWPNEAEAAIHLTNVYGAKAPAAAARITVYEVANDLPALRVADAGDRMIGYHTERGPYTMASTHYAGPLGAYFTVRMGSRDHAEFFRNWYTTTENFIKRMRFAGQNAYLMGHFMYEGTLYPSRSYLFNQNAYSGGDVVRDYIGLILRMFERNGLSMVSGVEYLTPTALRAGQPTPQEVRAGATTLLTVGRNGEFCPLHNYPQWPAPNYYHPKVQESILAIVDELLALYKDYPAWKGIAFILSRVWGPIAPAGIFSHPLQDPLDWGYEDFTIDRFQKDTGLKIPVSATDPDRFQKRYDWLMANARPKWIDWRCEQYTRIYRQMRDRVVKARPDLKLYLCSFEPYVAFVAKGAPTLDGHYDDPAYMKQLIRLFGFDVDALRNEPGMVVSYSYVCPGSGAALGAREHHGWREVTQNPSWQSLFANDGKGGAYIWGSIPHYGAFWFPKGKWLFEHPETRQGYFWPTHVAEAFVNVLVRSNPTWMPHTWMDVCESTGRMHELRQFARAYRSLPNGQYERLTGDGLDVNLWVERTQAKGAEYAYAANPHWWDADVTLAFAPGVKVHDLIRDQPVALQAGKWSFHLGPYEVQTFRTLGEAKSIARASVRVTAAEDVKAAIEGRVEEARKVVARGRAREAELRSLPGWQRVVETEKTIAEIEKLMTAGDLSRGHEKAVSWPFHYAQQQVVREALECIPFLVLGPFGDPKDTVGAGKSIGNPEVVPDYKGMETAFLGESDKPNLSTLTPNFKPDLTKTYPVYGNKDARWQEALKTYHLSFYGKAHSEHPFWMVAYAYTEIYSPVEREVTIWSGSPHALWAWCNDKLVMRYGGSGTPRYGQRPAAPDQSRANMRLAQGWNRLLLKAVQRGPATQVFFRISDTQGRGIDDLRFRVPKDERRTDLGRG